MKMVQISLAARRIFVKAGYRCCSIEDFARWHAAAVSQPPFRATAAVFCHDCMACVRDEMTAQGRCVRADQKASPEAIREAYASGEYTCKEVAEMFGISPGMVSLTVRGLRWPEPLSA